MLRDIPEATEELIPESNHSRVSFSSVLFIWNA